MYNPASFRQTDPDALRDAIRSYPLATLVTASAGTISATHLPMLLEGDVLRGHIARANPHWQEYAAGSEALAIFTGPQHYISPNWYPSKAEHGRVVPTWNYVAVHARGPLTFRHDPEWLRAFVTALTDEHERAGASPWKVSDAPPEYIDAQLQAIVGVEMRVTSLEGKWKLSQNRPEKDVAGVVEALGLDEMAEWMKRWRSQRSSRDF